MTSFLLTPQPNRLLDLILSSITNVRRELKFFEDVAKRYELDISSGSTSSISKDENDLGVSEGVTLYRKLFFEVGEAVEIGTMGMLEGMVLLWGTEVVCSLPCPPFPLSFYSAQNPD